MGTRVIIRGYSVTHGTRRGHPAYTLPGGCVRLTIPAVGEPGFGSPVAAGDPMSHIPALPLLLPVLLAGFAGCAEKSPPHPGVGIPIDALGGDAASDPLPAFLDAASDATFVGNRPPPGTGPATWPAGPVATPWTVSRIPEPSSPGPGQPPAGPGASQENEARRLSLKVAGGDLAITGASDDFLFVHRPLDGDGAIVAVLRATSGCPADASPLVSCCAPRWAATPRTVWPRPATSAARRC